MATETQTTSLGEALAHALSRKDFDEVARLLHPDVDFRGMTPRRMWEESDPHSSDLDPPAAGVRPRPGGRSDGPSGSRAGRRVLSPGCAKFPEAGRVPATRAPAGPVPR